MSAVASYSRDGLWTYSHGSDCGYLVDVTHRPTGRTIQIRGGVTAARRMAKSGELAGIFAAYAERIVVETGEVR